MTITDNVVPNLCGCDLGCGMLVVRLKETEINLKAFDQAVRSKISSGCSIRNTPIADSPVSNIKAPVNVEKALHSLGTQILVADIKAEKDALLASIGTSLWLKMVRKHRRWAKQASFGKDWFWTKVQPG